MFPGSRRSRSVWDAVRLEVGVPDSCPVVLHSFTQLDPDLPRLEVGERGWGVGVGVWFLSQKSSCCTSPRAASWASQLTAHPELDFRVPLNLPQCLIPPIPSVTAPISAIRQTFKPCGRCHCLHPWCVNALTTRAWPPFSPLLMGLADTRRTHNTMGPALVGTVLDSPEVSGTSGASGWPSLSQT